MEEPLQLRSVAADEAEATIAHQDIVDVPFRRLLVHVEREFDFFISQIHAGPDFGHGPLDLFISADHMRIFELLKLLSKRPVQEGRERCPKMYAKASASSHRKADALK